MLSDGRLVQHEAFWRLEIKMIQTTVNSLFGLMRPHCRNFPNDYLVFDVETTGTVFDNDLITQLGYCLVRDSKPVDQAGIVLDWTRDPAVPEDWLRNRMKETKRNVEFDRDGRPTGKTYHMNYEKMAAEGVEPAVVIKLFREMFEDARRNRLFFVAHNGYHFDARMLDNHFRRVGNEGFAFGDNELFDTGMVEKGSQSQSTPWVGETVKAWSLRTYEQRLRNVRWSLDVACVPRYRLDEKHNLNMGEAHDAGFDCLVTHYLFEEYKEFANGKLPEPPPVFRAGFV